MLSLVSLTMLLAVETQVSNLLHFDLCIVSVISVVVLLVKFISEYWYYCLSVLFTGHL